MHSKFRDTMDQNSFTAPLDAWPMVEQALLVKHAPDLVPLIDEQARQEAERVEARTGLPRTANGAPDSSDREMARALVDAGYMPLADYVAIYGDDVEALQPIYGDDVEPLQPANFEESTSVTAHFPAAFPRRQMYRPTTIRCTFAKPSRRLAQWERRSFAKSRQA